MFKNLEGARLGIFVFLGTALIFLSIFLVGNKESLFSETITLNTYFSNVEGLRNGASVRLSGMNVGTIINIELVPGKEKQNVLVTFQVQKSIINFIRLDSQTSIETEGLVGAKILSIKPGSSEFEIVKSGATLLSKDPLNMAEIINETTGIIQYTKDITKDFSEIVRKVNEGSGSIGKLLNDDDLHNAVVKVTQSANTSLVSITDKLESLSLIVEDMGGGMNKLVTRLDTSIADINSLLSKVKNGEGFIGKLINDSSPFDSVKTIINNLIMTTKMTQEGAEAFMENMEALKHNWLFKSYFEQRGYWDKADYEKELDKKILEIKEQNEALEERIKKLQQLNRQIKANG